MVESESHQSRPSSTPPRRSQGTGGVTTPSASSPPVASGGATQLSPRIFPFPPIFSTISPLFSSLLRSFFSGVESTDDGCRWGNRALRRRICTLLARIWTKPHRIPGIRKGGGRSLGRACQVPGLRGTLLGHGFRRSTIHSVAPSCDDRTSLPNGRAAALQ